MVIDKIELVSILSYPQLILIEHLCYASISLQGAGNAPMTPVSIKCKGESQRLSGNFTNLLRGSYIQGQNELHVLKKT